MSKVKNKTELSLDDCWAEIVKEETVAAKKRLRLFKKNNPSVDIEKETLWVYCTADDRAYPCSLDACLNRLLMEAFWGFYLTTRLKENIPTYRANLLQKGIIHFSDSGYSIEFNPEKAKDLIEWGY